MLALVLVGCATTTKVEERLKTSVGLSEKEVVQRLGPPDFVYQTPESKYLAYERSALGYVPGVGPAYTTHTTENTSYNTATTGPQGFAYPQSCQWGFELRDDHVVRYRYEGIGCLAK